ncbi:MAG: DNA-formamidopyrimidine glycosylase family protein [Alphaproteobacteria bacterium]
MPELPDIVVYIECLEQRVLGQRLDEIRLLNPFLLRSVEPALAACHGKQVLALRRLGKRIVLGLEDDLYLVIHLMIAGRLQWRPANAKPADPKPPGPKSSPPKRPSRNSLANFEFSTGTLTFTEAGSKRRASLHLVRGEAALAEHDPQGAEISHIDLAAFTGILTASNHTLKRALTDPRMFSGIGNAYSDEILHRARLSPIVWTTKLDAGEISRLFQATRHVLRQWTDRLRAEAGDGFPKKVTAFHKEMAVHGRYRKPCPDCGAPVQRIAYASNETNYCANCQTGGRLLADRSLSRLLKGDWPRTIEELERLRPRPPSLG